MACLDFGVAVRLLGFRFDEKETGLSIDQILAQLRSERDRLDGAIAALDGNAVRRGRSASSTATSTAGRRRRGRRRMSAAVRKRLAEMMRKRWAATKKAGKSRL